MNREEYLVNRGNFDINPFKQAFSKLKKQVISLRKLGYKITSLDLGGGVGCISSTVAQNETIQKIFCIELVEDVVKLCQPIVKENILGPFVFF